MDAIQAYVSSSEEEKDEIDTSSQNEKIRTDRKYDTKSSDADFFGLTNSNGFHDNCDEIPMKQTEKLTQSCIMIAGEKVSVEIPTTDFWSDVESQNLQGLQQQFKKSRKRTSNNSIDFYNSWFHKKGKTYNFTNETKATDTADNKNVSSYSNCMERPNSCDENTYDRKFFFIHPKISPYIQTRNKTCRIPRRCNASFSGHDGVVNRVKWNVPNYSHLLVSCSMDSTVKIWNVWTQLDSCIKVMTSHRKAVRDLEWSQCGRMLLTCSYDKTAKISDVETGVVTNCFQHYGYVTCGKFAPCNPSVCLTGGQSEIHAWDRRTPDLPCKTFQYKDSFGQVQDVLFKHEGGEFFTSSDTVSRDSADRTLMAWDFNSGVTLSNQIYQERYTLNRLKLHPTEGHLLAQSSGNYIALFSTNRPYKMNKSKRFEGHKMLGYSIGFDISPDGCHVVSGSSDGKVYIYNFQTGRMFCDLATDFNVVMDTAWHPVLPSTLASCGWDGDIKIWY